ncbi:MAG: 30S ribosomal protein S1 [Victivallales bacterium]|nr:30S ribosomal protein S1 [Victivallales bacterium]
MSNIVDLNNMPSMDELFGTATIQPQTKQSENSIVKAKIVSKNENGVCVDLGLKSEPFIDRSEFKNFDEIKVGDEIKVYLERLEGENSAPQVSVKKAEAQESWDDIVNNHPEGSVIKGTVTSRVKGGLIVDVGGVEAFLPGSQVDVGQVHDLEAFVNKELDLKILKINNDRKNIVVSRRELLEAERASRRATLLEELQKGQIRKGIVKNITDFGAFMDLNGMDGLLHITDMSWGRVTDPHTVVQKDQEIEVMILDVDRERQRVSLGLKQKEGNPWDTVEVKYAQGTKVHGKVVNVMPYGAFVELEEGIEGLIHVTEMSWTKKVNRASDVLNIGDEVDAVVLAVHKDERKISLGLRQAQTNPWELIKEKYPKGTRIKGKVRNMTGYGAFVQIQDDIDGMIHVSDMSWTRKINHPSEMLQKGQEVEAVILDVDAENQRISLSMKKLTDDPWQDIQKKYKVGDEVEGKVTKLASFGAFVELDGGIDGLIHISELSDDRVSRVKDIVQVGQTVKARVKNISTEERRIGLTMKTDNAPSAESASKSTAGATFTSTPADVAGLGGLGGILDDAFKKADTDTIEINGDAPAEEEPKAEE